MMLDTPMLRTSSDSMSNGNKAPNASGPSTLLICTDDTNPRCEETPEENTNLSKEFSITPSKLQTEDILNDVVIKRINEVDSAVMMLSALYANLLVVMGIAFPLSEVISPYIPPSYFMGYYMYLYSGSILFLIYAYSFLLPREEGKELHELIWEKISRVTRWGCKTNSRNANAIAEDQIQETHLQDEGVHCGSFYLRMGAVAFGIGSMIYCGLEFGQFFELDSRSECHSILAAMAPCTQMAFTFIQLYFIFMNSKMGIHKYKTIARFGLMHMLATNLCIWLHVLVQESKHEILQLTKPSHGASGAQHAALLMSSNLTVGNSGSQSNGHHRVTRGLRHTAMGLECRRINIMGKLVQDVSPFLFPCTIEYSLICAAILYAMWRNIGKYEHGRHSSSVSSSMSYVPSHRHQYSVDCANSNKGLFTGILVLVLAIISLILFFVLINIPEYRELAVLEAHTSELILYCLNTVAAVVAIVQVRELSHSLHPFVELDSILLIVAQTGVYLFAIFCVIGGHFAITKNTILALSTALANLIQATVQTIFILDAWKRCASTTDQIRRKPGREVITFLLVCNFAMWAINSLETRRSDSNPVQLNFYGFWAWTIIAHFSTPLAIFFRFHSTVCLCEIWKRLYKLKHNHV